MNRKKIIFTKPSLPLSTNSIGVSPIKAGRNHVILAIETSCDETAAAVIEYTPNAKWPKIETLSSIVRSQIKLHSKMGGVVPEVAARAHVKNIRPVVESALTASRLPLTAIDYIAVTQGPGLMPSLMVGVEFAKALAFATNKPMIPVNHMLGHLYSPLKAISPAYRTGRYKLRANILPSISLIVSGGHTILVLMENEKKYKVLGQTIDDAAGEAFDKVAKMLSLPYPGGPEISKMAEKGNPKAINFPRPMLNKNNYNFSFSGLKTSVLYYLRAKGQGLNAKEIKLSPKRLALSPSADVCASFEQAVVDVLVGKTIRAVKEFGAKSISLSGGVAANKKLRDELQATSCKLQAKFFAPPMNLCTDNAEMIGIAAAFALHNGKKPINFAKIEASPNLQL